MALAIRFVVGGVMVAIIPILAEYAGKAVAGVAVMLPVITVSSMYFIGRSSGSHAVGGVALSALMAVPTAIVLLGSVYLAIRLGMRYLFALSLGLLAWCVSAMVVVLLTRRVS